MKRFFRSERSQAMPEFALVAPILFLIIFGMFDIGRAVVDFVAIQHAANEGGRVASEGYPLGGTSAWLTPPTTTEVTDAAQQTAAVIRISKAPGCPNGPIPRLKPTSTTFLVPSNQGYIYVTDPETPSDSAAASFTSGINLPGGDTAAPGGCTGTVASGGVPLQVTVIYHYSPIVGVFLGLAGKPIADFDLVAYSNYETEY